MLMSACVSGVGMVATSDILVTKAYGPLIQIVWQSTDMLSPATLSDITSAPTQAAQGSDPDFSNGQDTGIEVGAGAGVVLAALLLYVLWRVCQARAKKRKKRMTPSCMLSCRGMAIPTPSCPATRGTPYSCLRITDIQNWGIPLGGHRPVSWK